jgi:hypothetical protein
MRLSPRISTSIEKISLQDLYLVRRPQQGSNHEMRQELAASSERELVYGLAYLGGQRRRLNPSAIYNSNKTALLDYLFRTVFMRVQNCVSFHSSFGESHGNPPQTAPSASAHR